MKRQFDDQDRMSGNNKRYRSDGYNDALAEGKYELRLLIPTKAAGAVIGKGGESIKSLRSKVCLCFLVVLFFGDPIVLWFIGELSLRIFKLPR